MNKNCKYVGIISKSVENILMKLWNKLVFFYTPILLRYNHTFLQQTQYFHIYGSKNKSKELNMKKKIDNWTFKPLVSPDSQMVGLKCWKVHIWDTMWKMISFIMRCVFWTNELLRAINLKSEFQSFSCVNKHRPKTDFVNSHYFTRQCVKQ